MKVSKFSVRMFLFIIICVVIPLYIVCFYVKSSMEKFIQDKLSERIIQNISRNERYISDSLQNMALLTNAFVYDDEFIEMLSDKNSNQYENTLYFNKIQKRLFLESYYDTKKTKITVFDNYGRIYSNWSLNYTDYQFILDEKWVQNCKGKSGHMVWSMFRPSYIKGEESKKYISLAKEILTNGTSGKAVGIIIISMEQDEFSKLLMEYAYEEDFAYVCIDNGEVLLKNDKNDNIENDIENIYWETEGEKSGNLQKNINGTEYLISYYMIPKPWVFNDSQMKVFHFTNYEEVENQVFSINHKINIVLLVSLCLIVAISYMTARILVRPIETLTKEMEKFQIESEIKGLDVKREDEIGRLNRAFCKMADNIRNLFKRLQEENEIKEKYRFESLRAQLNPHFLFNTLTSIRFMAIIRGADNIVESIDALAHMLKYSMSRDGSVVKLEEEINNIYNYIYIQNCRYGENCTLVVNIPENLLCLRTMKFILQPIVENAVIHGYDKNKDKITIQINGYIEDNILFIQIEDDGIGMTEEQVNKISNHADRREKASKLTGIGIKNVDECIKITYGEQYGLKIESSVGMGTKVVFKLPVLYGEEMVYEKNNDCG